MKKVFLGIVVASMILISGMSVFAKGYIVKINPHTPVLYSEDMDLEPLMEQAGLYYTDDPTVANEYLESNKAEYIHEDIPVTLFDTPNDPYFTNQWGYSAINANALRATELNGSGIRVGIIDSGVYRTHSDLVSTSIDTGYNILTNTTDVTDTIGHGTMVTGIISAQVNNGIGVAGIAPNCTIVPIKAFDASQTTSLQDIILALDKALELNCNVINMSLGTKETDMTYDIYMSLYDAILNVTNHNIIVVAAAGNFHDSTVSEDILCFPAGYDEVIGVGNIQSNLVISPTSQQNESVFVVTPGTGIYSTNTNGTIRSGSGTSFSTPYITALAAVAKQAQPNLTIDGFKNLLINSSIDLGNAGYDITYGYGLVDFAKFAQNMLNLEETNISGEAVTDSSGNITVNVKAINLKKQDKPAQIAVALYKGNKLIDIIQSNITIPAIDWKNTTLNLTSIKPDTYSLKVFSWKAQNFIPWSNIYQFNVTVPNTP